MTDHQCSGSTDSAEIEDVVIGYLHDHPNAADTLDGIVQWWIPQQRYENSRTYIECVLVRLVAAGLLTREHLPGGIELYALKHRASARSLAH
jgi:hypothetical protein